MQLPTVADELHDFYRYVWGTTEKGWVYLPTEKSGAWQGHYFPWPAKVDQVVEMTMAKAATEHNVFFSPALYDRAKGVKEHVIGSYVLWVDFDGNAPEEWPLEPADGKVWVPPPTLVVQSSQPGHQHCYWRMKHFLADVDKLEDRNRAIAYVMGADSSGWDANQILRPPHTTNRKRMLPVTIEKWDR